MIIYNYDFNNKLIAKSLADESPLEPGSFLIPAFSTTKVPPTFDIETQECHFKNDEWVITDNPKIYTLIKANKPNPYFKNGTLILVTDDEALTVTEVYEQIQISDEEMLKIKDEIWENIKNIRDTKQTGGSKVKVLEKDYWFHTDIQSQIQHLGLYETAKTTFAISGNLNQTLKLNGADIIWKCMNGEMLILTVQIVFDLFDADKKLMGSLFAAGETHKYFLYQSTDPLGYDYKTGWPEVYGE